MPIIRKRRRDRQSVCEPPGQSFGSGPCDAAAYATHSAHIRRRASAVPRARNVPSCGPPVRSQGNGPVQVEQILAKHAASCGTTRISTGVRGQFQERTHCAAVPSIRISAYEYPHYIVSRVINNGSGRPPRRAHPHPPAAVAATDHGRRDARYATQRGHPEVSPGATAPRATGAGRGTSFSGLPVRGGGAHDGARAAAGWPLVHRRSLRKARARADRYYAGLGESGHRRVDRPHGCGGRLRLPACEWPNSKI
jgi:hypothetical protein